MCDVREQGLRCREGDVREQGLRGRCAVSARAGRTTMEARPRELDGGSRVASGGGGVVSETETRLANGVRLSFAPFGFALRGEGREIYFAFWVCRLP